MADAEWLLLDDVCALFCNVDVPLLACEHILTGGHVRISGKSAGRLNARPIDGLLSWAISASWVEISVDYAANRITFCPTLIAREWFKYSDLSPRPRQIADEFAEMLGTFTGVAGERKPLVFDVTFSEVRVELASLMDAAAAAGYCLSAQTADDAAAAFPAKQVRSTGRDPHTRKRGREPIKRLATEAAMRERINAGTMTLGDLDRTKEAALSIDYGVSRDTARKARKNVLTGNADK